jgi:serralysin
MISSILAAPTNDETILRGGSGTDTLNLSGFKALGVTVSLETSNFQSLEDGQGYLSVSGFEKLLGTKRSDTMTGSDGGNETLLGGSGNDRLSGLAGDDRLQGQGGADKLRGGDGDDVLDGAAEDTFLFRARDGADTLMDFTAGEDHIQIIGAKSLSNINFDAKGADVEISYGKLSILVKDIDVATMQDADNFLF